MIIEDNIPIPTLYQSWEDLDLLEVGQSVAYPHALEVALTRAMTYHGKQNNKKFTRRTQGDVVRVWRIA